MILALDELAGKTLDYAYEKAKAYAQGKGVWWKWEVEGGVMVAGRAAGGRPLPYQRRHGLSDVVMRAHVRRHVGELVCVPTDLVSPKYAHAHHGMPELPRTMPKRGVATVADLHEKELTR